MSRYRGRYDDDDDWDVDADVRRRRNRQPTDGTIEIIRRRDSERPEQAFYEAERRRERRRHEEEDDDFDPRTRRNRRDDSIELDRERIYYGNEEELDMPRRRYGDDIDADLGQRRNRQQTDDSVGIIQHRHSEEEVDMPRRRGMNTYSDPGIDPELGVVRLPLEDEHDRRRRSPPYSRRRRNDSYRSPYFDEHYESDDRRPLSPLRMHRRRLSRTRDSFSSLDVTPPPPPHYQSRYRDISPSIYRRRAVIRERVIERSRSPSSFYSSSGEESIESQFPKKGKTRIPARIVSKKACIDLGYPFEEEGDVIIILKALGRENIDELLKLSEEYGVDRRLNFEVPVDMEGYPLQFDVNLVSQASDEKGASWNNATIGPVAQPWMTLALVESRSYTDDSGAEKVILTESTSGSTQPYRLRWIHMQQEHMSIESLEHLVRRISLDGDDVLVALHLLRRVSEKAERPFVHGRILKPIVLRGDSRSVGNQNQSQPDRHCTFINFPYFSLQAPSVPQQQKSLHTTPGLLQTMYLLESTKLRDDEQAIRKIRPHKPSKAYVLITYSTDSLLSLRGGSIEVQKSLSEKRSGPSVLRITDPYQRVFFFPLEQCKTWFELEELVYTQCELGPCQNAKKEYDIFLKGRKAVSGATWPTVLASEESPFVDIFVHPKEFHGNFSDDSESDVDSYLTRHIRPVVRRQNVTYNYGRRRSTREKYSYRTGSYPNAAPVRIIRGTRDSRRSTQRLRRSHSRLRTGVEVAATGLAGAAVFGIHGRLEQEQGQSSSHRTPATSQTGDVVADNATGTNETVNRSAVSPTPADGHSRMDEGFRESAENQRHAINVPNHPEVIPPTPVDNSQNLDSSNTLSFVQEADEGIVAEPESYVSITQPEQGQSSTRGNSIAIVRLPRRVRRALPALERRRSSYVRGDSMALVPFRERQSSLQRESPLAGRENSRPYRFTPRPTPQMRRYATLESNYEAPRVRLRRLPQPRRRGLLMDDGETYTPRRETLEIRRKYEDPYPTTSYSRKNTNEDSHVSVRSSQRPYRHVRGRPAPDGIVKNAIRNDELETGIYYTPKESIPTVTIPGHAIPESSERFVSENMAGSENVGRRNSVSSHASSNSSSHNSPEASTRERRSGSFNSSRTTPKSSVLPILMWPTGPAPSLGGGEDDDSHSDSLFDEKSGQPLRPPRTPKPPDASQARSNDESMQEILERIYASLLTDRYNHHDRLFREMETAHLKDAIYTLPDQEKPAAINQEDSGPSKDEALAGKSKYDPAEGFLRTSPTTEPKAPISTTPEYRTKLLQFSSTANELLGYFIPADYSNAVIGRYYGSVRRVMNAVDKFQKHNEISKLYTNQGAVFVIEDIGDDLEKHHLRPLSKPLDTCSKCKGRFSYKNDIDASNHLISDHFEADRVPPSGDVKLWIKKYHPRCDKRRCEEHLRILKICCNHLNVIHKVVEEIRDGVCTVGTGHNRRYRLPKALVEAFRKLILFLVYTSHVLEMITEHSGSWTHPDWSLRDDPDVSDEISYLQSLGYAIEETVDKGKLDLTLMIRTQDYTQSIKRHEAVGPQYILAMVLNNLQRGVKCNDLLDIYKEYIERLSFQVSQFPRRRLLMSLKYVHEEIESTINSMHSQHNLLVDYLKVLNPQSFRSTTEARISLFDLELNLIEQGIRRHFQRKGEFLQLQEHVQRLIEKTKTSVEINDDDHGKAILVFTIVTLVFLPLSFVTSFLGMNTVDIRNQTTTQSLFWIVALPITAVVVIVALIIGYKYEVMREWADKFFGKLKKE